MNIIRYLYGRTKVAVRVTKVIKTVPQKYEMPINKIVVSYRYKDQTITSYPLDIKGFASVGDESEMFVADRNPYSCRIEAYDSSVVGGYIVLFFWFYLFLCSIFQWLFEIGGCKEGYMLRFLGISLFLLPVGLGLIAI